MTTIIAYIPLSINETSTKILQTACRNILEDFAVPEAQSCSCVFIPTQCLERNVVIIHGNPDAFNKEIPRNQIAYLVGGLFRETTDFQTQVEVCYIDSKLSTFRII